MTVSTPYSGTETLQPGTVGTPSGVNVAISNRIVKGSFTVALSSGVEIPKSEAKKSKAVRNVTGTYITQTQGTYFPATDSAQLTGIQVVKFAPSKLGTACFDITSNTTTGGGTATGTATLTGGTKEAKTSRFSGTYTETGTSAGPGTNTQNYTGTLEGKLKFGKKGRGLSDACKALAAQLG